MTPKCPCNENFYHLNTFIPRPRFSGKLFDVCGDKLKRNKTQNDPAINLPLILLNIWIFLLSPKNEGEYSALKPLARKIFNSLFFVQFCVRIHLLGSKLEESVAGGICLNTDITMPGTRQQLLMNICEMMAMFPGMRDHY